MRFIVVIDDLLSEDGRRLSMLPAHGFSILIQVNNNKVLFNLGPSFTLLKWNLSRVGIDLRDINTIFISDWKRIHSEPLDDVLKKNKDVKVYAPPISNSLTLFKPRNLKRISIISNESPVKINEKLWSTGILNKKWYHEHALLVTKNNVGIIFLGCSAYGYEKFLFNAEKIANVRYIIGGLHLSTLDHFKLKSIINLIKSNKIIIPFHCVSYKARRKIIKIQSISLDLGVGFAYEFSD